MATEQTQVLGRALLTPAVALLFIWMIVPLAMTIYFSTLHYSLLDAETWSFVGLENFRYFLTDPAFLTSLRNTLVLVGSVLAITILLGTPLALLLDQQVVGRSVVRLMVIAPFFVMPTVSALVWKNLLMHPVYGLFAWISRSVGLAPIDWFASYPLLAVIIIIAWEWTPFAALILLAGLQTIPKSLYEAAEVDGASAWQKLRRITLPLVKPALLLALLFRTIDAFKVFDLVFVMTQGGPADATNVLQFYGYKKIFAEGMIGYGAAISVGVFLISLALALLYIRLIGARVLEPGAAR
jgi:sorbitol/mannitol transport system permease protein